MKTGPVDVTGQPILPGAKVAYWKHGPRRAVFMSHGTVLEVDGKFVRLQDGRKPTAYRVRRLGIDVAILKDAA